MKIILEVFSEILGCKKIFAFIHSAFNIKYTVIHTVSEEKFSESWVTLNEVNFTLNYIILCDIRKHFYCALAN